MAYGYDDPKLYLDMLFDTYRRDGIELVEDHVDILEEMAVTYAKKNADYGDSFNRSLDNRGLLTAVISIEHKFNRLDELVHNDILVENETYRDTLMDLANYAVMTIMWLDRKEDEFKVTMPRKNGKSFSETFDYIPEAVFNIDQGGKEPLNVFGERYVDSGKPMFEDTLLSNKVKDRSEQEEMNEIYRMNKESPNKDLRTLVEKAEDLAKKMRLDSNFRELGEEGAWHSYQDSHMNNQKFEQTELDLDDISENSTPKKRGVEKNPSNIHVNTARNLAENL